MCQTIAHASWRDADYDHPASRPSKGYHKLTHFGTFGAESEQTAVTCARVLALRKNVQLRAGDVPGKIMEKIVLDVCEQIRRTNLLGHRESQP